MSVISTRAQHVAHLARTVSHANPLIEDDPLDSIRSAAASVPTEKKPARRRNSTGGDPPRRAGATACLCMGENAQPKFTFEKTQVHAGGKTTLVVLPNGRVFGLGDNSRGQLSCGRARVPEWNDTPVELEGLRCAHASVGAETCLAVTQDSKAIAWGGGNMGVPKKIGNIERHVGMVSCGRAHSLIVTKRGNAYAVGDGSWGQVGMGRGVGRVGLPAPIMALSALVIRRVAAGSDHSIAIDDEGVVYAWGKNTRGETGTRVALPVVEQPTQVVFEGFISARERVVGVSARDHSLAWTEMGALYAWGRNEGGCLGNGLHQGDAHSAIAVRGLYNVRMASAGGFHSAVVCQTGALYTFGTSHERALGGGDCVQSLFPLLVMVDGCVTAACGYYHTAVVMNTGLLAVFGFGKPMPLLVEFTRDGYVLGRPDNLYSFT